MESIPYCKKGKKWANNNVRNIIEEIPNGKAYKKYIESLTSIKTITFGNKGTDNDVFIYDANGKVYYAKGFYIKGGVYYSDVLTKDGPIITADLNYNEERTEAVITISVAPEVNISP